MQDYTCGNGYLKVKSMKKIFLAILPVLLFVACKTTPIKTETRITKANTIKPNVYE